MYYNLINRVIPNDCEVSGLPKYLDNRVDLIIAVQLQGQIYCSCNICLMCISQG